MRVWELMGRCAGLNVKLQTLNAKRQTAKQQGCCFSIAYAGGWCGFPALKKC